MAVPPWCVQGKLPSTGVSLVLALIAVGLVGAGVLAIAVSRRGRAATLVVALLALVAAVGLMPSPASANDNSDCPVGFVPISGLGVIVTATPEPGLWARVVKDYSAPFDSPAPVVVPDATFAVAVEVKSGGVKGPITINVPRPNTDAWGAAAGVKGEGWSVTTTTSAYQLTFTPSGSASVVPPAVVTFAFDPDGIYNGFEDQLTITPELPAGAVGKTVGGAIVISQITVAGVCTIGPMTPATWLWDKSRLPDGAAVMRFGVVGGTAPYTFATTDLKGFTLASDGTIARTDGSLEDTTDFTMTITDKSGNSVTIPAEIDPVEGIIPTDC